MYNSISTFLILLGIQIYNFLANISMLYYGNSKADAKDIGFDDSFIYDELALPYGQRHVAMERLLGDEAIATFNEWKSKPDKTEY